jgi:hypothetical protein
MPAEGIYKALAELGFCVTSVKQMRSARGPPAEVVSKPINLPLFLITLPRTEKSQDIFKLTGFCHMAIKVEAY